MVSVALIIIFLQRLLLLIRCSSESAMIPQCAFLLSVQLLNLGFRISSFHILKSVARKDQVLQEKTKAWLHILLDIAVMSSVILSDPYLPHSPTPVSTMIVTAFLAVLDMFRLDTLLGLYSIKWVCFALLEVGQYMRVPSITLLRVGRDVLQAFTFGTVLPLTVAAISEAYQRESFLRDCRKSMRELKPFWSSLLGMIHRLPGLSGNPLPQDPHRD